MELVWVEGRVRGGPGINASWSLYTHLCGVVAGAVESWELEDSRRRRAGAFAELFSTEV